MEDILKELLPLIQDRSMAAFRDVLGVEVVSQGEWEIVPRLVNACDHAVSIGCCNDEYQGICTLGADEAQMDEVFPGLEREIQIDGLGEIGNTIGGLLAGHERFAERFGILTQAPPLISTGGANFPRAWGAQGRLVINGGIVFVGFALRSTSAPSMFRRAASPVAPPA